MKVPRKQSEIKEDIQKAREVVWKFEEELKRAKEYRKKHCPHPQDKVIIKNQSWMEEGRMRSPVEWKEKICKLCGKVLATSRTEIKEIWSDDK